MVALQLAAADSEGRLWVVANKIGAYPLLLPVKQTSRLTPAISNSSRLYILDLVWYILIEEPRTSYGMLSDTWYQYDIPGI